MRTIVFTLLFCLFSIAAILKANVVSAQPQLLDAHNTIPALFDEYPVTGSPLNIVSEKPGHLSN